MVTLSLSVGEESRERRWMLSRAGNAVVKEEKAGKSRIRGESRKCGIM